MKKTISIFFVLLCVHFLELCECKPLFANHSSQTLNEAELDAFIQQAMNSWHVPGLALAIIKNNEVVHSKGYGVREWGKPDPVDSETIFAIASCTKAFTATSLGMLVDEGTISWDDTVISRLPNFSLCDSWLTENLTLRDILSHRAGIAKCDALWYSTTLKRAELIDRMKFMPIEKGFRTEWHYHNLLYMVAGQFIPVHTGLSWDEFITQRIFTPLRMNRSSTSVLELSNFDNLASPHLIVEETILPISWKNTDNSGPSSSINSCVKDMAQWVRFQLNHGVFEGTQLIRPKTLLETHTPHSIIKDGFKGLPHHFNLYGLGWALQDFQNHTLVHHTGTIDGMQSHVAMLPELNMGVVILTNAQHTQITSALVHEIFSNELGIQNPLTLNEVLLRNHREFIQQLKLKYKQIYEQMGTAPLETPIKDFAGIYQDDLYGQLEIREFEGGLICKFLSYEGPLMHLAANSFLFDLSKFVPVAFFPIKFTFIFDMKGHMEGVTLHAEGLIDAKFLKTTSVITSSSLP